VQEAAVGARGHEPRRGRSKRSGRERHDLADARGVRARVSGRSRPAASGWRARRATASAT
jgi:hypothetical protein